MLVIGHRGAVHATAPENTLPALDRALRQGADGVEVDVRVTADGVPVCHHDATYLRTTGDHRQVSATAYVDAPWIGSHRVPRLSEVVDLVEGRGELVVELKTPTWPHGPWGESVDAIAGVLRRHRLGHVTVSSFDRLRLRALRGHGLGCPTALIGRPAAPYGGLLRQAVRDGHEEVHAHLSSVLTQLRAPEGLLREGRRLGTWTVDRPRDLLRMREEGLDLVISDDPQQALEVLSDPLAATG